MLDDISRYIHNDILTKEDIVMRKLMCTLLVVALLVAIAAPAYATEIEREKTIPADDITLDVSRMSERELVIYQEVLQNAIDTYSKEDPEFDANVFVEEVNYVLYLMEYGNSMTSSPRALIEFSLKNSTVATAVNIAVSLLVGGATTAALKAYIGRLGATVAANTLAQAVTTQLLALGIKEVSGVGTVIRLVVQNVLDPGSTVAEYLDNNDVLPGNGYVDVALF